MQEMETALSPQYHLTMMMKTVINLIIYIYHYDEVCVLNAFSAFPLQLFFLKVFVGYNENNDDDQANGQSQLL